MEVTQKKRNRFYILLSALFMLTFLRYGLQIGIPEMVILALAIGIAALGDQDEIIAMFVLCIPLNSVFSLYMALAAFVALYLVKFPGSIRINIQIIPFFLMLMWEILHCFSAGFSVVQLVAYMLPLFVGTFIMMVDVRDLDYSFVVRVLCFGTLTVGAYLITQVLAASGFNMVRAFSNMHRLGMGREELGVEISGGEINPNSLGVICVLALCGLLQLVSAGKSKKSDVLLIVSLLTVGLLTTSKTFLVCFAIVMVLYLLGQRGTASEKGKILLGGLIVGIVLALITWRIFPGLLNAFLERFEAQDITSGRSELFSAYNQFIFSSPRFFLWGTGLNQFVESVLVRYSVTRNTPHNGIQEIMVAWGFPGLFFFGMFLWMLVSNPQSNSKKRTTVINYLPLITVLAKAQAGQWITSGYTMIGMVYAYLSIQQDFQSLPGRTGMRKK